MMNKAIEKAKKTAKSKRKTHRPCPIPTAWARCLPGTMGYGEGKRQG